MGVIIDFPKKYISNLDEIVDSIKNNREYSEEIKQCLLENLIPMFSKYLDRKFDPMEIDVPEEHIESIKLAKEAFENRIRKYEEMTGELLLDLAKVQYLLCKRTLVSKV